MTCTAYSCQVMATRPAQDAAPADTPEAPEAPAVAAATATAAPPVDPQRPRLSKAAVVGRAIALADARLQQATASSERSLAFIALYKAFGGVLPALDQGPQ